MYSRIEEVKAAIGKVEQSIEKLEKDIDAIGPQIEQAARRALEAGDDKEDRQYWRDEVKQLRDNKNYLLDEKLELQKQRGQLAQALFPPPPGGSQVQVYRLLMKLWNAKDFPGVRREVYQILAQSGACYPTNKDDAVRYDGKTLCIQALTHNDSDASRALGAISVLIQQRMSRFPGQIRIDHAVTEPSEAAMPCWETILATDYLPDASEDISPQGTASDSRRSDPDEQLNHFQSFDTCPPRFRDKAYLISKDRLRHMPLSKLNTNHSNFLALDPNVHAWFGGRNFAGDEVIAIRYEGVTQDQPPNVTLRVIPVDGDTAEGLVSRLRDFKATTDAPCGYLVNVHVSDPSLFRVCITWKYNKTVKAWVDRGCAPEGATRVADYDFGLLAERIGGDHDLEEE